MDDKTPADTQLRLNELKLIENAMTMRYDLMRRQMGEGDKKDIDRECGYPQVVDATNCKLLFDREGIAKRVVQVLPDESWKMDPEVCETEDDNDTPFEKAWKALAKRLNVFSFLRRADVQSGIGTYGIILLGLSDGATLDQPVAGLEFNAFGEVTKCASTRLLYQRTFDETQVTIAEYETNPSNFRFGQPKAYNINFTQVSTSAQSPEPPVTQTRVHWHRIVHLADNRETSEIFGTPRMKPVFNRLYDLRKVLSSSAEMFWKGGFPGLSFEVDPSLVATADFDKASLRKEMEQYSNGLQRYLALVGVSAKSLAPQVADPASHFTTHIKAICVSLGIPYRIFLGSEEAQMAGEQDSNAWNERLKDRQQKYITPMVLTPYINALLMLGCLPPLQDPEALTVNWPDLHTRSAKDKADVAKLLTEAMASYVQSGGSALMGPRDFLMMILNFSAVQADAIMKAVEDFMQETDGDDMHPLNPKTPPEPTEEEPGAAPAKGDKKKPAAPVKKA